MLSLLGRQEMEGHCEERDQLLQGLARWDRSVCEPMWLLATAPCRVWNQGPQFLAGCWPKATLSSLQCDSSTRQLITWQVAFSQPEREIVSSKMGITAFVAITHA